MNKYLVLVVFSFALFSANAHAYVDPGTGSLAIQFLIGGLVVLAYVVFRVWYDGDPASLSGPLQLCASYWHFLLGVWLVLFALLTSRPETINALAALCGF